MIQAIYNLFLLVHPILPSPKFIAFPPQLLFGAIFALYLVARIPFRRNRRSWPAQRIFFGLFIWLWMADLINLGLILSLDELKHVAGRAVFFVFALMTYYMVTDAVKFRKAMKYLAWAVVFLGLFTIFCGITNYDPFGLMRKNPRVLWGVSMVFNRTQAVPMSYGEYGLIINSILPVFIFSVYMKDFFISRKWALLGIAIVVTGLFITQSRNSWLATIVMCGFLWACWTAKSDDPSFKGFMVMFIMVFCIVTFIALDDYFSFIWEGFSTPSQHMGQTFSNRLLSDKIAFECFLSSPLFGVGHAAITTAIANVRGQDVVVHNGYMDQLAGTGLFGFIPFVCILSLVGVTLLRMARYGPAPWRYWALCLAASGIANGFVLLAYKGFFSETFAVEYGFFLCVVEFWEKDRVKQRYAAKNLSPDHYAVQPGRQHTAHIGNRARPQRAGVPV